MSPTTMTAISTRILLACLLQVALAGQVLAADVYLVAKPFTKTMPDTTEVPMWGFATDFDSDLTTVGTEVATVPGPRISVLSSGTTLNIHVRNDLSDPISIVIPGQPMTLNPVKTLPDGQGRQRAVAFTNETAPGATETYTWTGLKAGSYIYHSGSHPAVQVQMGLYGAVTVPVSAGIAYPGISYDSELLLFYSEIDTALHQAVDSGIYGTPAYPSAIDYNADYFLVNGDPYAPGTAALPAGGLNQDVLVRFFNGGLRSHVPTLLGDDFGLVAEDGNPYPYSSTQYSVLLAAGKTRDAIWTPTAAGTFPVYDRSLHLTSAGVGNGGMLSHLAAADFPCGDVSGDGVVSIVDALLVAQTVVGLRSCTTVPLYENCDINPIVPDGGCNIGDALRMAQCAVGLTICNYDCTPIVCIP